MKCLNCQFENPPGIKLCGKCCTRLQVMCPKCGFSNPPEFTFYSACGHNLSTPVATGIPTDLSFDEKLVKIQKNLPVGLTEKILSQRKRIVEGRREVTNRFVDMKRFASPSTRPMNRKSQLTNSREMADCVREVG